MKPLLMLSKKIYRVRNGRLVERRRPQLHRARSMLGAPGIIMAAAGFMVVQRSSARRVGFGGPTDPWTNLDGRLGAPSGPAQFPTLLNSYPNTSPPNARVRWPTLNWPQPPWMVAGVDYAVGPNFTPTKVPGITADPPGTNTNPATNGGHTKTMVVTGTNSVIDGFDFTQNGVWTLRVGDSGQTGPQGFSPTITNNLFFGSNSVYYTVGGDGFHLSHGSSVIKYNIFDGGSTGAPGDGSPLLQLSHGDFTLQYNLLKFAWSDWIQAEGQEGVGTCNWLVNYNFMMNTNMDNIDADVHGDWFQPAGGTFDSIVWAWNCLVQNQVGTPGLGPNGETEGIGCGQNNQNPIINGFNLFNNTFVTGKDAGFPTILQTTAFDPTKCVGVMALYNNYFDTSGISLPADFGPHMPAGYPAYIYVNNSGGTPGILSVQPNNIAMADVISLSNGSVLTPAGSIMAVPV